MFTCCLQWLLHQSKQTEIVISEQVWCADGQYIPSLFKHCATVIEQMLWLSSLLHLHELALVVCDCFPTEKYHNIENHSKINSLPCADAKMAKSQQKISDKACTCCWNYSPGCELLHIAYERRVNRAAYLLGLCCRPSVRVSNNQWSVLHQSGVFSYSAVIWSVWAYYYTTPTNYTTAFVFPLVDHLWHGLDFLSTSCCCCNWILGSIKVHESLPRRVWWWLQLRLAQSRPAGVQTPPARRILYSYFIRGSLPCNMFW